MKLAVINLTGGGLSGGYRKYLTQLMPLLAADTRVQALQVYVPAAARGAIPSIPAIAWPSSDRTERYRWLRAEIDRFSPDVVFVPTARVFRWDRTPVVAMVRNMEPLLVPFGGNRLPEALKNIARSWEARRACRAADRVMAVSCFVRDFLVSEWRVPAEKVGVVYHGVDQDVASDARPAGGGTRFVFTAGSIRPARGLEDAIRAIAAMRDAGTAVQLVIAGREDPEAGGYQRWLRQLADRLRIGSLVVWAGQLTDRQMADAFDACAAFVMTSRAEACPNTALEAMSHACATVSVDRQPMPEFFGDAALYYPLGDWRRLAEQLLRVLPCDSSDIGRMRTFARQRAAAFTWQATADATIRELEAVLR